MRSSNARAKSGRRGHKIGLISRVKGLGNGETGPQVGTTAFGVDRSASGPEQAQGEPRSQIQIEQINGGRYLEANGPDSR